MITNINQFRVRYGETDQMGVVYHGNYANYLELGRIEWLRKFGISYKEMEEKGIMLPVISLNINYLKPAKYDDLLTIKTILKKLPSASISFEYELFNDQGELLTTAVTKLVFIDKIKNRPTRAPEYLMKKLLVAWH